MKSILQIASFAVLTVACSQSLSVQAETWLPLAWTEMPGIGVPGQPNARHFILEAPTVNDGGQVAFHSFLNPITVGDFRTDTIWSGPVGQPQLVAREGDAAPGTTESFEQFNIEPHLNNAGQVLLSAQISGPFSQRDGLWLGTPGNLELLARTRIPMAGLSHRIDSILPETVTLGDGGEAAFMGFASTHRAGIWHGAPGELALAAMEGESVPSGFGLSSAVTFQSLPLTLARPRINAEGTIVFRATISDLGEVHGDSIWMGTPGNIQLLVREETVAPGTGEAFFTLNTDPVINDAGQVAFGAHLTNFNDSIWIGTPGNLNKILEGNDPAPVGSPGVRFADFGTYTELRLSDSGHVGFEGWLEGTGVNSANNFGLFRASTSGVDMVARLGSPAPGMQPGAVFEFFQHFSINSSGSMAVMGTATGGGISGLDGTGIWAENSHRELELVVRVGDWVHPISGDVVRLVDATDPGVLISQGYDEVFQIDFRSAFKLESESGTAWNTQHEIAFEVTFADPSNGSAIFVANLAAIDGDFDGDGDVDGRDFLVWQRTDGSSEALAIWQTAYGQSATSTVVTVPEPAVAALLASVSLAAAIVMRRFDYLVR
jgi:hypothetical protein